MKEAISGTWLFQIVIVFMLIFFAFITISINYSRAFRVKNEVISIIEREEGLTEGLNSDYGAVNLITHYLKHSGYISEGKCPTDSDDGALWKGLKSGSLLNLADGSMNFNDLFETVDDGKKYHMCVKKIRGYYPNNRQTAYYKVQMFIELDMPVFGRIGTLTVTGQTTDIQYPQDEYITWTS